LDSGIYDSVVGFVYSEREPERIEMLYPLKPLSREWARQGLTLNLPDRPSFCINGVATANVRFSYAGKGQYLTIGHRQIDANSADITAVGDGALFQRR
jgi:hypothetical protein|tara:strand:- start:362 stop:655 length:294 start_codon:yes stop_codon:yes gene_type:complete